MKEEKKETIEELIEQLEIYRLENRISQQNLANQLGVTYATVSHWLNRKSKPNKIQTYQIKKLLNGQNK